MQQERRYNFRKGANVIIIDWEYVRKLRNQHWTFTEIAQELGIPLGTFLRKKKQKGIDLK